MKNRKIIIAGPCSAESHLQMMNSAAMLSLIDQQIILRAGCWKPRTSPGEFEGYGEMGLSWLKDAANAYGLDWMTEAGTAKHAEMILKHEGKKLWIGARTTGDPFSVEEIAIVLEGTEMEVWIKNPPQPDIKLWIGALERMKKRKIKIGGLIHRGFKVWPQGKLRNSPIWKMALEMKKHFPEIPIIADPSHMAGEVSKISSLVKKAICLGADGLMIEMHPQPENAMTDKEQQLSPMEFYKLLRNQKEENQFNPLEKLRIRVDEMDELLWKIIGERMKLSEEIGKEKEKTAMPILQSERMQEVLSNYLNYGNECNLKSENSKKLFDLIHEISISNQTPSLVKEIEHKRISYTVKKPARISLSVKPMEILMDEKLE